MYYFLQTFSYVTTKLMDMISYSITTFLFIVIKITIIDSQKKKKKIILT